MLVTGFDIIFFWVARMMMMGLHMMGDVPFRTVYIHGLVRDEKGQKMSKSRGNVIDPLELIDSFGADALRFTICALTGPGRDVKLGASRVQDYRGFVTKLWNAARFCEMNGMRPDPAFDPARAKLPLSRWLLDTANTAVTEATAALDAYRFDEYAAAGYRFVWNSFCDWFLEFAKPLLADGADPADAAEIRAVGAHVLGLILRLLHPAIPFVTEELWDRFGYGEPFSLIGAAWPEPGAGAGSRGSARGTRLGDPADRRGPLGAGGDERAAVASRRPCCCAMRRPPCWGGWSAGSRRSAVWPEPRTCRLLTGDVPQGVRSGGAGRNDDRPAAGGPDRHRG